MRREPLIGIVGLLLCVMPALAQHSGIQFHGTPASVTSPGVDGRPRGIAASVTDPTFTSSMTNAGHVPGNFAGHHRHRSTPVFAVPYYGYYGLPSYDSSEYEQSQPQQPPPPQVIVIREESSSSNTGDEDSHYGEHSFNSLEENRESSHDRAPQAQLAPAPKVAEEELLPMTTLVYRDGHKSEVRNYAIVGGNLIDLTKSPVMKKIPLDSLDLVATRHENEENGVDFHLP